MILLHNATPRRQKPHRFHRRASETTMPYRTNEELPFPIRHRLPPHAQDIYREAFNHAFAAHAANAERDAIAARIAWGAVKRNYIKIEDTWVPKPAFGSQHGKTRGP